MPSKPYKHKEQYILRQIALQFGFGAALGAAFALVLLFKNMFGLHDMIADSVAPRTLEAWFVIGVSVHLGLGAALTAFLMLAADDG
ncbi:hypothetical protein [Rhodopseudomonas palustris]|uniref:Chloride channel protein n=1 Tax=Rhodopseudomonas palustris (strain BisB18) TaxID=316056 RepID=Q215U5_RHOPB